MKCGLQRNTKHFRRYGALFVRHEYLKFWLPREWKPAFDVANSAAIGTSSSCCCVEFLLCVCGCLLSVDNQDADVLQKFAHYLWVDRRFGPFASVYCYCLRRVCWHYDYSSPIVRNWLRDSLLLHDFTSGCHIPASLSWNVLSYSLLSFYLDLSLSILPCSLFCYYIIMSPYVTIGTVNQMYSTVFWKGL